MEETKKTLKSVELFRKTAIALLFIGSLCFIIALLLFLSKTTTLVAGAPINPSIFSNFGDLIGGVVGAIWSLAGVLLFYAALRLQREDLILQRKELVKSREIAESQNKTFHIQRFENTFFNLINLHHEIVKGIDIKRSKDTIQGRDCFRFFYKHFEDDVDNSSVDEENIDGVILLYEIVYEKYQSDLGHYFRNLYHIFKFIKSSDVSFPEQHRYANFARAQLSSSELLLLFYNALSQHGKDKFKPLIETFQILKNMPKEHLIRQTHVNSYQQSAFQRPETD